MTRFLELLERNENFIAGERAKISDKSLKDPTGMLLQFGSIVKVEELPIYKESLKL